MSIKVVFFKLHVQIPGCLRSSFFTGKLPFPLQESFTVKFGDHLRSGNHLRARIVCAPDR